MMGAGIAGQGILTKGLSMRTKRVSFLMVFAVSIVALAAVAIVGGAKSAVNAAPPALAATPGPSGYHLLKKIPLPGEKFENRPFWDYLEFDSSTRRLFISRSTKVVVVNVDTEKVVGEVPNTNGVHGIALAPDLGRGFASNGHAGTVTIFDLKTLQVIGEVKAGKEPDGIAYDPFSKRVFTVNADGGDVTVIDAAAGKLVGTVTLTGKDEFTVVDGTGHVYVNVEDKSELWQIDSKKLTVTGRWPLAPCQNPSGLAIDSQHHRIFAGCHNKMLAVVDADSGKVVATPAIGPGVDANRYDPATGFAFSSNGGDGTFTVIHEDSPNEYSVLENVPTLEGARTMALDTRSHEVYIVGANYAPLAAPTKDDPRPRPIPISGTLVVLVFGR
jgi:DNA-binding beta-propeller fold protein YncE